MNELALARRQMDAAWSSFVLDGRLSQSTRPEVLRSWHRALAEWRIDPALRFPLRTIGADELAARLETNEAFHLASPLLTDLAERLAPDGHTVAFVDGTGVILTVQGNDGSRRLMADSNFAPGACWSEQSAGTNAVGLALIEARPIEIFASEHFVEAWQPWTCASVPVRSAGRVVGVLDITSPWIARQPNLLVCAETLAWAIEGRLEAVAARRCEALRAALLEAGGASACATVDLNGRLVAVGPSARRMGWDPDALRAAAFAPLLAALSGPGSKPRALDGTIELAGRPVRVACSPVELDGRVIGAIVRDASAPMARTPTPRRRRLYGFDDILGSAPSLAREIALGRAAARNVLPVLVVGASGTGKEVFAQAIHSASDRSEGPFVALNCGAIPQSLLEAELFGYEGGAFTGGRKEGSRGRIEDADGGTLFLDEVSELSPPGQTALLRVLQEREVTRVGSSMPRPVDFRLVAASNKDLAEEIRLGRFRQDLFYRLNVLRIELPPLRRRREDVPLLADHYLALVQLEIGRSDLTFSPQALAALAAHDWPGNVRELKNVVERVAVATAGPSILLADLPPELRRGDEGAAAPARPTPPAGGMRAAAPAAGSPPRWFDGERATLQRALEDASWNVVRAARSLGISRSTLYRRLLRYGLTRA